MDQTWTRPWTTDRRAVVDWPPRCVGPGGYRRRASVSGSIWFRSLRGRGSHVGRARLAEVTRRRWSVDGDRADARLVDGRFVRELVGGCVHLVRGHRGLDGSVAVPVADLVAEPVDKGRRGRANSAKSQCRWSSRLPRVKYARQLPSTMAGLRDALAGGQRRHHEPAVGASWSTRLWGGPGEADGDVDAAEGACSGTPSASPAWITSTCWFRQR